MALTNDITARLYLNGDWRDVSSDVRADQGISYSRGRQSEDDTTPPTNCRLTLGNGPAEGNGAYTERNPLGTWYGYLSRYTPAEVMLRVAKDTCGTTVSNGWGSMDSHAHGAWTAYAWTTAFGAASAFAKAAGKATQAISSAGSEIAAYLASFSQRDLDVTVTISTAVNNVTGGSIGTDVIVRMQGVFTNYYYIRMLIETDESITLDVGDQATGSLLIGGKVTVAGLTHASSQALKLRVQAEGQTIRAKVWAATGSEPFGWHLAFTDEGTASAGSNALRAAAGSIAIATLANGGNTNVPFTFSYDDIDIRLPIASGEVSEWPQARDATGRDQTVQISIGGPRRRLTTAKTLARSALYQQILVSYYGGYVALPHAYFPLEDDPQTATGSILEATGGLSRLKFLESAGSTTVSKVTWGADTSRPGSRQSPTMSGGGLMVATLSPPTSETLWSATWQWRMDFATGGFVTLGTLPKGDSPIYILLSIGAGLTVLDVSMLAPFTTTAMIQHDFGTKETVEAWHSITLEATQSGADVGFFLYVDGAFAGSYTKTTFTLRGLQTVQLSTVPSTSGDSAFGHLAVYGDNAFGASPFLIDAAARGMVMERPVFRAKRIAQEYGFELDWIGEGGENGGSTLFDGDGKPMGAQRVVNVLDLLNDAEKVDGGILYEKRALSGFQFRTTESMSARSSWVTLNQGTSKHITDATPVPDDRNLCNRFTASRADGGEFQLSLDAGAMSTLAPSSGGIGVVDRGGSFNLASETDLPDIASYRVARGTINQERYPSIVVDLHRAAVNGDTALVAKLRDLDIGDQVTLAALSSSWIYDDRDVLILGLNGYLDQLRHTLKLVTTPAELLRVWTPGSTTSTASEFARADSDYTTLNAGLTATAGSLTILVAATRSFWVNSTTHPNNFPFDVITGGEVMRVTAGTAPAGQNQTWTVTRSINGVVKTHVAGQKISLVKPNYLALGGIS